MVEKLVKSLKPDGMKEVKSKSSKCKITDNAKKRHLLMRRLGQLT